MSIANTKVISAPEAAVQLRVKLGPIRAWSDFLSDAIRDRANINGFQLLPCAKAHDGRTLRPWYALDDVNQFIADVLASCPDAGSVPIRSIILPIDKRLPWQLNRFDGCGNPMIPKVKAPTRSTSTDAGISRAMRLH